MSSMDIAGHNWSAEGFTGFKRCGDREGLST